MKKIAILQSSYIPWKGYFDIINMVDEFILYDDVQYTKRDWRSRNRIKTSNGPRWLTIPVISKNKFFQKINEVEIADNQWGENHWKLIQYAYNKAKYFNDYISIFEPLYLTSHSLSLSQINYAFISKICELLDIKTKIYWSSQFKLSEGKTEKLVSICKQANATEYISGPSAKDYIDQTLFNKKNIRLTWMDYSGYPEYEQLYPPFTHEVSIIDLLFNEGPNTKRFMKSFNI